MKDYKVLIVILQVLPVKPAVSSFVVDYEAGMWKALWSLFVHPTIHGCVFYFSQTPCPESEGSKPSKFL